jgi:hypothetical protein
MEDGKRIIFKLSLGYETFYFNGYRDIIPRIDIERKAKNVLQ